ncbi:MAG: MipA/OmpV family protein [Gammaproteobacteria bacterium]|nr:MipA/OmpV family protein [Gammaproteobacteria bacterium]
MSSYKIAIPLLLFLSAKVLAADPTRDVRQASGSGSAYAEIGFGLTTVSVPLVGFNGTTIEESDDPIHAIDLSLEGRAQYKGLFAEIVQDSFSNITIGYSVFDNEKGSLELIATNQFGDVDYSDIDNLESIEDRPGDISLGVRTSYLFDDRLLQFELVSDVLDSHNGYVGAVHVGQQKQVLNWNFYGLAGIRYFSENVIDHFFGVSAAEATAEIPQYQAADGVMPSIQLGAIVPLSEKWTVDLQVEYAKFPDSVSDSPLAQGEDMYIGRIGVNYILFN